MTNEKQLEAEAKVPTREQQEEKALKSPPDEKREPTDDELAAVAGGPIYVNYAIRK